MADSQGNTAPFSPASTSTLGVGSDVERPLPPKVAPEMAPPPPEAAPEPSKGASDNNGDINMRLGGIPIYFADTQVPMLGVVFSSMISLIAACLGVDEDHRYYQYSVAVGAVGMSLGVFAIFVGLKPQMQEKIGRWMAGMIFLWSIIAACVLTFGSGPFTVTGNGYFSIWGMVIFSTAGLGVNLKKMQESAYNGSSLLGLGVAALILVIDASIEVVDDLGHRGNLVYAIVLACVTIVFVERVRDVESAVKSFAMSCLGVMWMVAACLLTFDGPFKETGNGYFASWGATVLCISAANDDFLARLRIWLESNVFDKLKKASGYDEGGQERSPQAHSADAAGVVSSSMSRNGGVVLSNVQETVGHPQNNASMSTGMSKDPYFEDRSTENVFSVAVDMPGVDPADVDVTVEGTLLKVSGTRQMPGDETLSAGTTTAKSFPIDLVLVNTDQLSAKLESGVLVVTAPRRNKADLFKARKIHIN